MTEVQSPSTIEEIMNAYQVSRDRAVFIKALIDGDVHSDVFVEDKNGVEHSLKFSIPGSGGSIEQAAKRLFT